MSQSRRRRSRRSIGLDVGDPWTRAGVIAVVLVTLGAMYAAYVVATRPAQDTTGLGIPVPEVPGAPAGPDVAVPAFAPTGNGPARVLFTGDSLTEGYFATTRANGFARLVEAGLGVPVDTVSAARADQTLTTVASITDVPPNLDLAVIELGTNDVGKTPVPEFRSTYDALTGRIRAASPDAALICVGVWRSVGGQYDTAIQSSCAAAGGTFVPIAGLYTADGNHGPEGVQTETGESDNFHPNDRGHRAIADAILRGLGLTPSGDPRSQTG